MAPRTPATASRGQQRRVDAAPARRRRRAEAGAGEGGPSPAGDAGPGFQPGNRDLLALAGLAPLQGTPGEALGASPLPPALAGSMAEMRALLNAQGSEGAGPQPGGSGPDVGSAPARGQAVAPPSSSPSVRPVPPATAPATSVRAPDGCVDYYMQVHWDPAAFHTFGQQIGYPDGPTQVGLVDKLLPPDTSPEVRAAIQVATAIGSGILDDWVITEAANHLGLPADLVKGLAGLATDLEARLALDDPMATSIFVGMTLIDGVASGIESVVDGVLEDCANLQLAMDALTVLSFGLGQIVALGAGVLAPPTIAAIEGAVLTIDGWLQGMHAALEVVRVPAQTLKACIDTLQAATTTLDYVYLDIAAGKAEADHQLEKAVAYRDLARGLVIDQLMEWMSALMNIAFAVPMIGARGKEFVRTGKVVANAGRRLVTKAMGGGGEDAGGMGAVDVLKLIADEVAKGTDTWHQVGLPGMQPDLVRTGRFEGIGLDVGDATGRLDAARRETLDHLEATAADLDGADPLWHQKLIQEIASPPDPSLAEQLSPTAWLVSFLEQVPGLLDQAVDGSLEGLADACDTAATWLPRAQPLVDGIDAVFQELEPTLDEALRTLDATVQQQDVDLARLEGALGAVEQGLEAIGGLADVGGEADRVAEGILEQLEGMRLDPADLALPDVVPSGRVEEAFAPIDAALDAAVARVRVLKDDTLASLDATVDELTATLQAQLDHVQASVAEGGAFRTELEAQVALVKATVAALTEAMVGFDGFHVDCEAGADWLRSVGEACRAAAAEEAGQGDLTWPQILETVAQPEVDRWRAAHADSVHAQYLPEVPRVELDAIREVYGTVRDRTDVDIRAQGSLAHTFTELMRYRGQTGRDTLLAFWALEGTFVEQLRRVEDSAE